MRTARAWRRVFTVVAAGSVSVFLLGGLTPASAAPAAIDTKSEQVSVHDHPMGSQIAKVEGHDSTPEPNAGSHGPQSPASESEAKQARETVSGIDVSGWQKKVDWDYWWDQDKRFAYVKATEGTGFKNPYFAQQYNGSYNVGMIRGAYHFALPDRSSGAAQARYFVRNGGGWSADGQTLPGALDLEYNPYGDTCYDKNKKEMAAWIRDFHDAYHDLTSRWPVIYTSARWWNHCVGPAHSFDSTVALWVARYASSIGTLPGGWDYHTLWQYTSSPIDKNSFNGSHEQLRKLAIGVSSLK